MRDAQSSVGRAGGPAGHSDPEAAALLCPGCAAGSSAPLPLNLGPGCPRKEAVEYPTCRKQEQSSSAKEGGQAFLPCNSSC